MKKILYITNLSRAINVFCVPHINMLKDQGYTVDCACYEDKKPNEELIKRGVKFYNIPFSRNPLNPKNLKALKALIEIQKNNRYDIIHVHTPTAAVYGRLLKLKFKNTKIIYTAHGFHFYQGAPKINWLIYYPIEKILAYLTDTIITINKEDYEIAKKFKIKNKYYIEGVGIDLEKYNSALFDKKKERQKMNISEDSFIILMIADVNKNKNHIQMIKAIELLADKKLDIKVLCAGEGPLINDLKEYINKKDIEDYIEMLGFRNDINELISICDIGILMSYREGLPKNIMELMAYGKPVIATNIRGNRDLVEDEKTGYLVDIDDYETTAQKILTLYNNREYIKYFSNNSLENIKKYDLNNVLEKLKQIY